MPFLDFPEAPRRNRMRRCGPFEINARSPASRADSMHWGRVLYPAVLFNNPHDIVGKSHRDDREGDRKKRLFEDGHTDTVAWQAVIRIVAKPGTYGSLGAPRGRVPVIAPWKRGAVSVGPRPGPGQLPVGTSREGHRSGAAAGCNWFQRTNLWRR